METHASASTRNPLSISVVREIGYKRERVLVGRIALVDNRVLSACTVTGGRRITVVVEKRHRA